MNKSQEIFHETLEIICDIDNKMPQDPQIKRLYFLLYQLGKRQGLID